MTPSPTNRRARAAILRAVPLLALLLVLVSVLLPNTAIAWMRDHWAWFNAPMLWIERADSAVNLIHGMLFLLLGWATRPALPHWRPWRVLAALLLLAAATELVQYLIPGRHPRLSDATVDVVAGGLGWVLCSAITFENHSGQIPE